MKQYISVRRVSGADELAWALRIRLHVFVREQRVPQEIEIDRDDARAVHLIAFAAGKPVGAARITTHRGNAKIGRMAVLKSYRRRGIGKKLLQCAVATARKRMARSIYLHAQLPVIGFYETLGFRCRGPVFMEAAIPHRKMTLRRLSPKRFTSAKR